MYNGKREFDFLLATACVAVLSPLLVLIGVLVIVSSGAPVFYRQERVGRDGKLFVLYKFRTMVKDAEKNGTVSVKNDQRITVVGKILRKWKLDELPQLFNVLKGDMSFVGPRPELPKYVSYYSSIYDKILAIRPGITDLASITFKNESELIKENINRDDYYIKNILPVKLNYNLKYIAEQSLVCDIELMIKTIFAVARNKDTEE